MYALFAGSVNNQNSQKEAKKVCVTFQVADSMKTTTKGSKIGKVPTGNSKKHGKIYIPYRCKKKTPFNYNVFHISLEGIFWALL